MSEILSNCFGFALCRLGIIPEDVYIDSFHMGDYPLVECSMNQAQAIAVLRESARIPGKMRVAHMAVIDPLDKAMVFEREGIGVSVQRVSQFQSVKEYLRLGPYHVVGVRVEL